MVAGYYDVIVVGAGPAGSMAAYSAAKNKVSVLVLEKDREIGIPVRCAEAIGKDGIEKILDTPIDPRWIAANIERFQFVAPDGTTIYPQVPLSGYVLHRKLFDFDLAKRAANLGAQIVTKAYVYGLYIENDSVAGVHCNIDGVLKTIRSEIVIGADGVESRVARWAGIDTTVAMRDMETCCQMTLANLSVPENTCVFYFSQNEFPGGYGWLFPKGDGTANIGLGISGNNARKKSACSRLKSFIEKNFKTASILHKTVGGVPCCQRIPRLSTDGVILVGDAALQANPVSGGGIATGMTAGKIAGKIAADAIHNKDVSGASLNVYEKEWDKVCGDAQRRYYRLKEGISKLTDDQLNKTAHSLKKIPQEKQTLVKIFQTALINQPGLFIDIVKSLSPFS